MTIFYYSRIHMGTTALNQIDKIQNKKKEQKKNSKVLFKVRCSTHKKKVGRLAKKKEDQQKKIHI